MTIASIAQFRVGAAVVHETRGAGTVTACGPTSSMVDFGGTRAHTVMNTRLAMARSSEQANNDNDPALPTLLASDLAGEPVPDRAWYVDGLIPCGSVTLLSGDGGTGKSLLALQIAVAGAMGGSTLGMTPKHGRVLMLAAEDDRDELHRRLVSILRSFRATFSALGDRLALTPLAGIPAALMSPDPKTRRLEPTRLLDALRKRLEEYRPALLILDTSADLFDGDEINRVQVRQFVGVLRSLAIEFDCAVLLLSHPSVAGMQTGSGLSGSTAWNNSVRSRLYLTADKDDDDVRLLKTVKANYGRKGDEIRLRWHEGAFDVDDGRPRGAADLLANRALKIFLDLLSAINRSGQRVISTKGTNYAPKEMAEHPDADGVTKKQFEVAMRRAMAEGKVKVYHEGPPSKRRQRLAVVADEVSAGREA